MLGLKRRKRVEGWAIDVSETNGDVEHTGLIQRMAENNRVWIACIAGVMLLTLFFVKTSSRTIGGKTKEVVPLQAPTYFRDRDRYTQFEQEFRVDKRFSQTVLEDRFLSPGRFQIIVYSGVSADEIDYVAKWAAGRVKYLFHHRTSVQVYKKSTDGETQTLVATAQWEPKKGGYTVNFQTGSRPKR